MALAVALLRCLPPLPPYFPSVNEKRRVIEALAAKHAGTAAWKGWIAKVGINGMISSARRAAESGLIGENGVARHRGEKRW